MLPYFFVMQMSTDCGVGGLITNIRQSPSDDGRKRLFELATSNSGTYFTASQVLVCALSHIRESLKPFRDFLPLRLGPPDTRRVSARFFRLRHDKRKVNVPNIMPMQGAKSSFLYLIAIQPIALRNSDCPATRWKVLSLARRLVLGKGLNLTLPG